MQETFKFKKKFGQNFLKDKNIVNKIVNSVDILSNSLVIEVGCGDGRLTKELCKKYSQVLGYEIDNQVISRLRKNVEIYDNVEIIEDDFLNRDIVNDISKYKDKNIYVVANLPYYITSPIIEKIISSDIDILQMIIMVQKEVGDRFCAKPGTKEYNSLTVYLNYNYDVKKLFIVDRNSFVPSPNVDSVVMSFLKKDKIFLKDKEHFYKLIRDSFRFKRKTLKNNLFDYDLNKIKEVLIKYNLDLSIRAEQIPLDIFCDISNNLSI